MNVIDELKEWAQSWISVVNGDDKGEWHHARKEMAMEALGIISRHQSTPTDYAEFKAWKENKGKDTALSIAKTNDAIADKLHEVLHSWFGMHTTKSKVRVDYEILRDELYDAISPYLPVVPLAPKPEAKTEEGLMKWVDLNIKKYGDGNSTFEGGAMQVLNTLKWNLLNGAFSHPATLEPLACLASRKGWFVVDQYICKQGETSMGFREMGKESFAKVFNAPTYAACEQLARTWLEEQKEGA